MSENKCTEVTMDDEFLKLDQNESGHLLFVEGPESLPTDGIPFTLSPITQDEEQEEMLSFDVTVHNTDIEQEVFDALLERIKQATVRSIETFVSEVIANNEALETPPESE